MCERLYDPIEAEARQAASRPGSDLWNILEGAENISWPQSTAEDIVLIRRKGKNSNFGESIQHRTSLRSVSSINVPIAVEVTIVTIRCYT